MTLLLPSRTFSPHRLRRRQRRCRSVVERILQFEREVVTVCNVCGSGRSAIIADHDRYGLPIRTAMCLDCGLIYVVDRLTAEGYAHFYGAGIYRALIARFKGKAQTIQQIRRAQIGYASRLAHTLQGYLPPADGARLLDVGGSTGLVAERFQKQFGFRATVIDPAPHEVTAAQSLGIDAVVSTLEGWETDHQYDLILLCRTVEHLFDLKAALQKVRGLLKPNGLFYCDIADFMETCRREGPPEAVTKIDHVFWLSQETAVRLFRSFGFEIVCMNLTLPPDQVGFLLRAGEPQPLEPLPPAWAERQMESFRTIRSLWQHGEANPHMPLDWLRTRLYRLRRALLER